MEKLANALFSMRGMAVGMIIFFVAIAKATFIESSENTQAAKVWVYNALWFELLLVFLSINLVANIMRYKMWRREKVAVFAFHISFLIIILGAALTRYAGFEGMMHIREGESTNMILAAEPYVYINVNNGKLQYRDSVKKFMAEGYPNSVNFEAAFPGRNPVTVEYVDFKSKHIDSLIYDPKSKLTALDIVVDGMQSKKLMPEEDMNLGGVVLSYSKAKVEGISIFKQGDSLVIKSALPMQSIAMPSLQKSQREPGSQIADSLYTSILPNTVSVLKPRTLYQFAGRQFVFKQALPNMRKEVLPSGSKKRGTDYLTLLIKDGSKSKTITLTGGVDDIAQNKIFSFNGLNYALAYGRRYREIPFTVGCVDFQLERYAGSNMPASFASDIVIVDEKNNVNRKKHLYMNHVVDYAGYRFFQSSYDEEDEKGTVLSVNYDWWGTNVTYLGYLLMAIGMILSITARGGRFKELLEKLNKSNLKTGILLFPMLLASVSFAQDTAHDHDHDHDHSHEHSTSHNVVPEKPSKPVVRFISEEHSDELASLLVQDFSGRIIPFHTLSDQLLRKLYRGNTYKGHNAVQVILSMHLYQDYWVEEKIIQVPTAVQEQLKLGKYASMKELAGEDFEFKCSKEYETALNTPEVKQNEYQKKLIKLGEKFQVFAGIAFLQYLKIIPLKGEKNNTWFNPIEIRPNDSIGSMLAIKYLSKIDSCELFPSKYPEASAALLDLKALQRRNSVASILPSETHVKAEISYNKMQIFKNSEYSYLVLGIVLLIIFFIKVFITDSEKVLKRFSRIRKIFVFLLVIIFLYHGTGVGMRWYISGHAPWSNGYEAVVFIAWVTMLTGLIFSRRNAGILAGTALLSSFMILVTEMNLLDPQITPLQPVLQSYWLMIHVAIITSSYGFLGLACILGIFNTILFAARNTKNSVSTTKNINELTYVSELTMTIGTFMLTIGTFLGGIWANESWGRYWGWDPKETWALVSVLVYAIILHLRYIPGLNGKFVFTTMSMWGYAAILFTFFGVNFILVGLHSYAQGDGSVSLPNFVWYSILAFALLTVFAGLRNRSYNKKLKASL